MKLFTEPSVFSRRLLVALVLLGLFVLFDIGLFSWLIFRSLSQREIDKIRLETYGEGETLAAQILEEARKGDSDLYQAIAVQREVATYIDSVLRQREIVKNVEILDKDGRLVFRSESSSVIPVTSVPALGAAPADELPEVGSVEVPSDDTVEKREIGFRVVKDDMPEIRVPIGDLGDLVIGISEAELSHRLEVLRQDLVQKASVVGGLTLLIVLSAGVVIWFLLLRARRLEEQAAEAERMAYIGTLASGLAHEIRSPLNSLNLNMQMLEEDLSGDGSQGSDRRLLTITRSEISRLERLVTDFLTYAKPRSPQEEEVSPAELFEGVRELLAGEIQGRGAQLEVEDRSEAKIRIDPAQMRQLLLNLLQNAFAATEGSGRPPRLGLKAWAEGGSVILEVSDNGMGIPAEDRERVFDLFYSTRHGGTGLGLAIVQRIARVHGGSVAVDSSDGEGTRIRVELPRCEEERKRVEASR